MSEFKSTNREEFICISYYDTEDLPIDRHCIKYINIKYDIQEVLERTDDIDYVISDSKTTRNLLKEQIKLKQELQQKENIIKEVREEVRILESNCDISNYHAQKLYQTLDKEEVN